MLGDIKGGITVELIKQYMMERKYTESVEQTYEEKLANFAMGLGGESGEVIDILKKALFHGHGITDDTKEDLTNEIGDICWYLFGIMDLLGIDFEDVLNGNLNKLQKRYKEGFSKEASINRDLEKKCLDIVDREDGKITWGEAILQHNNKEGLFKREYLGKWTGEGEPKGINLNEQQKELMNKIDKAYEQDHIDSIDVAHESWLQSIKPTPPSIPKQDISKWKPQDLSPRGIGKQLGSIPVRVNKDPLKDISIGTAQITNESARQAFERQGIPVKRNSKELGRHDK